MKILMVWLSAGGGQRERRTGDDHAHVGGAHLQAALLHLGQVHLQALVLAVQVVSHHSHLARVQVVHDLLGHHCLLN